MSEQEFNKRDIQVKRGYIYWLAVIAVSTLCFSCDIHKKSAKTKTDTTLTEDVETKTFRQGDTVHYSVPNVTLRDTVIYTYNRQGTTLKTVYDSNGQVKDIDCIASAIELYEKRRTELEQTTKEKEKEKTEDFDSTFVLYIVIGLVVVVIVAMLLMFSYVKKNTRIVTNVLENLKI
jgi:hypothetical protein